jgi:prepilin signal peptidase PulO-like enzyme (type II secretory pathway)
MVLALVGRGSVSAELIISGCIGAMLAFALFAMIYLFGRYYFGTRALGFGDVMLATMIGAVLGPIAALWALAMGLLLAGCYALWLLWHRHAQRLTTIPFAPFLAFPALVALWLP